MRALFLSAALSVAFVGEVSAASTALLVKPAAARTLILDGRVWRCDGATCAAAGEGRSQSMVRECARLARKLGPFAAYGRNGATLDRAGLERCNRGARVR